MYPPRPADLVPIASLLGMGHSYEGLSPSATCLFNSEPFCLRVQLTGYRRCIGSQNSNVHREAGEHGYRRKVASTCRACDLVASVWDGSSSVL